MDIYITDMETNDTLRLPMLPEEATFEATTTFLSHDIVKIGTIKSPFGEELSTFSWSGQLPGESRKNAPYVKEWKEPKIIQGMFSEWRTKGKKLRLMITETPINHDVYLERYSVTYKGGYGDYYYDISFVQAKDLEVSTVGNTATTKNIETRPAPPQPETYTVKSGDTLWKIAYSELGNGSRYPEIATLNGIANPNFIKVGQVLKLPT